MPLDVMERTSISAAYIQLSFKMSGYRYRVAIRYFERSQFRTCFAKPNFEFFSRTTVKVLLLKRFMLPSVLHYRCVSIACGVLGFVSKRSKSICRISVSAFLQFYDILKLCKNIGVTTS